MLMDFALKPRDFRAKPQQKLESNIKWQKLRKK
jgi:hypothetical protein